MSDPTPDFPKGSAGPVVFDRPSLREARELIESQGLLFEPEFDDLAGLFENGQLVACGARAGYVLKMLAIAPSHQGTDALGGLVTKLILSAISAGHDTVFVFTLPQNVASFEALNFRLLVTHGKTALLEHGPGLEDYLAGHASQITQGHNGAVVINGNPFTLGHLYLVECAAQRVDRLYLFVVREDRSVFPFEVRFRLAEEATVHLRNVTVLDMPSNAWNCLASWRGACPSAPPGCAKPLPRTTLRPSDVWCHRPPLNFCNRRPRVPSPSGFEARWRKPSLCKSGARPVRAQCNPAT